MNLVVFVDGTWNDRADNTNVAQLAERARAADPHEQHQRIFYEQGVGVLGSERLRGGLFGFGLGRQVVKAYEFIAAQHRPGDRLFLFGYSRGAFTARSLAGMIAHCGIVPADIVPARRLFGRYRRARSAPGLIELATGRERATTAEDFLVKDHATRARIRLIGVFDTVGGLGIPLGVFRRFNHERHGFHDTQLSGLVDEALHAVAVDERRSNFPATLWSGAPERVDEEGNGTGVPVTVRQIWFRGSHPNVGGGGSEPEVHNRLSVVTREWMAAHAVDAGLRVAPARMVADGGEWDGRVTDSYGRFLWGHYRRISPPRPRPIGLSPGEEDLADALLTRWERRAGDRPGNPGLHELVATLLVSVHRAREVRKLARAAGAAGSV